MTLDLILVGFGNVGRRFATLVHEQRRRLARDHDLVLRIVAIVTRRHDRAYSARGLDANARARARSGRVSTVGATDDRSANELLHDALRKSAAAARERRLVVVETTTLDIARGEPAIAHVRAALAGGAHVVTANKGPAAFAYHALARAAARADRRFLFEGAVMDGVPIFNLARETLPAVSIIGFRGVVNSTTNYILSALENGQPFDRALRDMQTMGIAEADASLDLDGWDAAAKTAALANVLLGAKLTPHQVERQGISADIGARAVDVRRAGGRLKLVARATRERSLVVARVAPEELARGDPLAVLDGPQNALILQTDLLGEIAMVQLSGDLTQTAYALLSDLVTIARDVRNARDAGRSPRRARQGRSR